MRMHGTKCLKPIMANVCRRRFVTRLASRLVLLAALIAGTASCGDVARQGRAPVFLVIDRLSAANGADPGTFFSFLLSDVQTLITTGGGCTPAAPCPTFFNDPGQVALRIVPKGTGSTAPTPLTTNNEVTITRYRVSYRRADGRNAPGTDVPHAFDGAVTGTVGAGSTLTLGFQLVRNVAKKEAPLVQLVSNPAIITMIADVTFYGQDRVGNDVSATGSIQIDFGNFGD
jgi:hypothetical protein